MKCPYCIKVCTKCKRILVAWEGNFYKNKQCKYGVIGQCIKCKKQYGEQYYGKNKKEKLEYQREYNESHKEEAKEYRKQYYEENKEEIKEKNKQYKNEHKEYYSEYMKQYYEENKEEIKIQRKKYYKENKEYCQEYMKQYHKENPHISFNATSKRRERLENQGRGITKEQWYEMMCWFDWCCAYSGEYISGDNNNRTIDHIIPISKGGLNEPWNCVSMLKSYNISKFTNNMEEWYIQQEFYSEERLIKIYAWCKYAFNKWKPRRKGNKKLNFF